MFKRRVLTGGERISAAVSSITNMMEEVKLGITEVAEEAAKVAEEMSILKQRATDLNKTKEDSEKFLTNLGGLFK
jgi:methyl-accepting chemotaxis protein